MNKLKSGKAGQNQAKNFMDGHLSHFLNFLAMPAKRDYPDLGKVDLNMKIWKNKQAILIASFQFPASLHQALW